MMTSGTCGGVRENNGNIADVHREEETTINGDGPGYRDLTDKDKIQFGDIFYDPKWEVGGPWYLVRKDDSAIGKQYVPGKMKWVRRPISE